MDFKNKVVIITGASSGIGEVTALHFAKFSASLVLVGRNVEKLNEVSAKCDKINSMKSLIVKADLTNDGDVKKIVDETIKGFKKIDVLINNAGAGIMAGIQDGVNHLDLMLNTNLRSVYLLTSLTVPHLIKTKGNIVNVSSIVSQKAIPDFTPYCVSKAALDMLTKCNAKELAVYKVRVNSVNPGPVVSEFHDRLGLGEARTAEMMRQRELASPLGKIATSEDVAKLIAFLASDEAASMTGSICVIDNGFML